MVAGYVQVEHVEGWTRGTVPDRLHPWNRSQNVPVRGRPGLATPLVPLNGPGLSEGGAGEGAYGLTT